MSPTTREVLQQDVCLMEKYIRSAVDILGKIDEIVDPCHDFYKFACGKFLKNALIPIGEKSVSSFTDNSDKVRLQFYKLLEGPDHHNESYSLKLLKTVYKSCMNTKQIEKEGLTYVKKAFKDLGGWPVVEPYWNETKFEWTTLAFRLLEGEWTRSLFFITINDLGYKKSGPRVRINPPDMDYKTLQIGPHNYAVKALYKYMVEFAVFFGADKATATSNMEDVIEFQTEFARLLSPGGGSIASYRIEELQKFGPRFPWLKLINNFLFPMKMLVPDDSIYVYKSSFFRQLVHFLPEIKKRTLANYMFSTVLASLVQYLPEEFENKWNI
ncbi:neprilysin-1-like [Zophobas morio]|uniref:neprilysin-1-like n=1 Tax=Zophobas morio TaxID=2755281 RepID=UPI00308286DD